MSISITVLKKLWARAGNTCAFPGCRTRLVQEDTVHGHSAHIIASSPLGPRGVGEGAEDGRRDDEDNIILLCPEHHQIIDANAGDWPAKRLRFIKRLHEAWVEHCRQSISEDTMGTLVVFCGPSSVGKDVVASRVMRRLHREGIETQMLRKYTTRLPRDAGEGEGWDKTHGDVMANPSATYDFKDSLAGVEDTFFSYSKYEVNQYAFSRSHLGSDQPDAKNLICILGCLHRIAEFRRSIRDELGREVFAILLEADEDELLKRLELRRAIRGTESSRRKEEIVWDLGRIAQQRRSNSRLRGHYDLVVENSHNPLPFVEEVVYGGVHQWLNWVYADASRS